MIKELGLAGLLSLGIVTGVDAQNGPKNNGNGVLNFPKVPSFYREYEADVPFPLSSDGKISWQSKSYLVEKDVIREIRGECDLDVNFLFFGVESIYVGFITRINAQKKTIESIVYYNGPDKTLSPHDTLIANQENIDLSQVSEINHEFIDYNYKIIVDMENLSNTALKNNAVSFQEGYFLIPKTVGKDTTMTIRYDGKNHFIDTFTKKEDGEEYIYVDLTMPDPENPGERKNIVNKINWLKIYYDRQTIPYRIIAKVNGPLGSTAEVEAEYETK